MNPETTTRATVESVAKLMQRASVELELGCGANKKMDGAIGIDALAWDGVDLVGDVFEVLRLFPDASVDAIYSFHFLEHLSDVGGLLDELARVVKRDGSMTLVVPHFSNPYFHSDPTHRTSFGLYTFCYFCECKLFSRQVPTYQRVLEFELTQVDLIFKSGRPFFGRHAFKKLVGAVFNFSRYTRELYEEVFCYLFPCYEVRYRLRRR